jgi:hypothetical protein
VQQEQPSQVLTLLLMEIYTNGVVSKMVTNLGQKALSRVLGASMPAKVISFSKSILVGTLKPTGQISLASPSIQTDALFLLQLP